MNTKGKETQEEKIKSIQDETRLILLINTRSSAIINDAKKLENLTCNRYIKNMAKWVEQNAQNIKTKTNGGLSL